MKKRTLISVSIITAIAAVIIGLVGVGNADYTKSGGAMIWTDKDDYSPGETVTINGSGFNVDASVAVSVTRPDGRIDEWSALSDGLGSFKTTYWLEGMEGTYTVIATDGTNTAMTIFTDPPNEVRKFTATISPTTAYAGETKSYTIRVTNDDSSNKQIKSIKIVIPTGFTGVSITYGTGGYLYSSDGKKWSATIVAGTPSYIDLNKEQPQAELDNNQYLDVPFSATAPSTGGTYTWTTTAYEKEDWKEPEFDIVGNQPTVTVLVSITITSSSTGSGFVKVDNVAITTPQTFTWTVGSTHTLEALSPVSGGTSTQYVWISWSDSGAQTHDYIVPNSSATVTANYKTQYYLTVNDGGHGTPGGEGWYDADTNAQATITPLTVAGTTGTQYVFNGWTDDASGSGSPSNAIFMNGPKTATATWETQYYSTLTVKKVLVPSNDTGKFNLKIDDTIYANDVGDGGTTGPQIVSVGSHTVGETAGTETNLSDYVVIIGGDCASDGTITLAAGEEKTCTITNNIKLPKLTVTKVVINDNGGTKLIGDFPLFVDNNPVASGVQNTFAVGLHKVSETGNSGYSATFSGDCDANGNITLNPGDVKSCTITNDDIAPKLTITKIVKNDDGGTLGVGNFELFVNGSPVTSGKENTFNVGSYTVSETQQPGYIGTIGGNCAADGSITLNLGDVKKCTITNDDIAPGLTVIKNVINNNGGTLDVDDFTLYINDTPVTSGQSNILPAGTYVVREDSVSGYAATIGGDCDAQGNVTLNVGETKVCTITNNDIPTSLTLNKVVINDNGGAATASEWTLTADGPVTLSGVGPTVSSINFWAGTFTLSESGGPAGYNASEWVCEGGSLEGNQLTLSLGETATCTITNDDQPGTLIVKKIIINDNGGTKTFTDFSFSINGGEPVVFEEDGQNELTVNTGVYNITESAVSGYTTTYDNCENVIVPNGGSATCTITNDDIPGEIHGMKFNDLNGNGVKDEGEAGLAGWNINLSGASSASTTTDENGNYAFIGLNVGTYTVTETPQDNWMQTTPNPAPIEIGLASIVNDVDFGNIYYQENLGAKFAAPSGDFASTNSLIILEDSTINVPVDGGTSTISLLGGTIITRENGSNIDVTLLTAEAVTSGSLTGLGTGVVVGGALKWGLEALGLKFDPAITVSIFVGTDLNGQTLDVLRSITGNSGWTSNGINGIDNDTDIATCLVTNGLCTFQATKASYYVATYTPPSTTTTGGGGGGGLILGLTIPPESVRISNIGENSVTITWTTSYFSTSQVIYDTVPGRFDLNAGSPKYGYAYSKEGDDSGLEKVTSHSVTITGLSPGTTYYYRTVSHGSLAISEEHSFTTLGVKIEEKVEEKIEEIPPGEEMPAEEVVLAPTGEEEAPKESKLPTGQVEKPEEFVPEGAAPAEEGIVTVPPEERVPGGGLAPLLLASLGEIGKTPWMAILVVFCLIGLVIIGIREWELARKKKKSIS